ncbi:MAG: NAD(P)/FAD-dependent oxidoreductase [Sneathiellales bacterium]|nr:NAD(P)/FAD-dependent oxidoreductase [Sneathiellales bacterium]
MSINPTSLDALNAEIVQEFAYINYPPENWVKPLQEAGQPLLDVAIIGGGANGMAAWFGLNKDGIRNIRIFDKSPRGFEGPWITTARMQTLRSPKHLTGPNLGFPKLTFRSWFEASMGVEAWEELDKIPTSMWMDYLKWYREVLDIPVENDTRLIAIEPASGFFRLTLQKGTEKEKILARHVVLATGRAATGGVSLPEEAGSIPEKLRAHTEDKLDYSRFRDKRILVIGGAASAADSAATALEKGAKEVHMLIRAEEMPRLNKFKAIVYPGFMGGFSSIPKAERWAFLKSGFDAKIAAPRGSMLRLKAFENFYLHFGSSVTSYEVKGEEITAVTSKGEITGDFVIFGTGYAMDLSKQPELSSFAEDILLWKDCYTPPPDLQDQTLGSYPYLGEGFQFLPKEGREAEPLSRLHLFNSGTTMTHAPISSDIPGANTGVARLVDHLTKRFFKEGAGQHFADFEAYEEPELLGDEWKEA